MKNIDKRKPFFLILFVIVFIQNSYSSLNFKNKEKPVFSSSNNAGSDTTIFTNHAFSDVNVLSFDDDNTINVPKKKLKLIVKEETEDTYSLSVVLNNKKILIRKNIYGISKVWLNQNYLAFSIFTYADEDGNNRASGYIINLKDGSVTLLTKKLKNTCNPLVLDNYIYFVDGLSLIKTDLKCNILKAIRLKYINEVKQNLKYFDSYTICQISSNTSELAIFFSPNKSKTKCQPYCGVINDNTNVILIKKQD